MNNRKSNIHTSPTYFDRYIQLIDDIELGVAFEQSLTEIAEMDLEKLNRLGDRTYAPGKWTIRQIIQHLTDWERIMSYRALIFARKAAENPLPGHDQDVMIQNLNLEHRPLEVVIEELKTVRAATITLFASFDQAALENTGYSWEYELSTLAWGFTILGHQKHHFNIIRERYLALE
jgi:hypothetical protein